MKKVTMSIISSLVVCLIFLNCADDAVIEVIPDDADARRKSRPVANAGSDVIIKLPINKATLDGSQSKDTDGQLKSFLWEKVSGPSNFVLNNNTSNITEVADLTEGIYIFRLTVKDNQNLSDSDSIQVTLQGGAATNPIAIKSFTPTSGIIGSTVIISGSNFSSPASVSFNGATAQIQSISDSTLTVTVPLAATSGPIQLNINNNVISSGANFNVLSPVLSKSIFEGNMDNVTISRSSTDKMYFNGWNELQNHPYISELALTTIGDISLGFWETRQDPTSSRKTLYGQINDDDPAKSGTTRTQLSLRFNDGVNLPVYHTSHRMYMHPDIAHLSNYPSSFTWFTLFEIWSKHIDTWTGDIAGSARWTLSINKDDGVGSKLYWRLKSDYMQPAELQDQRIWTYYNKAVPIPTGKWVTFDMYMKRGEGSNGKIIFTMTPDGGTPVVVFNISNSTIYPGRPDIQLSSWQPFKIYLGDVLLDYMRNNNKVLGIYYNDFKWFED